MNGFNKVLLAVATAWIFAGCAKKLEQPEWQSAATAADDQMQAAHFNHKHKHKWRIFNKGGDIDSAVQRFRDLLGPISSNELMTDGRREINWDDVVIALTNNDSFPGTYYHRTDEYANWQRKRGVVYTTPGTGFRVTSNHFSDIDPSYLHQFYPYSGAKTFTPLNSNIVDFHFKVPGTNVPGYVTGFGAVFSDVDQHFSTQVSLFSGYRYLGTYTVKPSGSGTHSFFGFYFPGKKITRVRVKLGNASLKPGRKEFSGKWGHDLVVLDDLIFSNPKKF